MSAVVLCIVVVGSCMAVVVVSVTKGLEDATRPVEHGRGRSIDVDPEPELVPDLTPTPDPEAVARVLAKARAHAHAAQPRPASDLTPRTVHRNPEPAEPVRLPRHAARSSAAATATLPARSPGAVGGVRRRPSPAEMARRAEANRVTKTPWWTRLRAAMTLSVLAILLGLATAGAVGLVAVLLYTVLRSAV